MNRTKKNLLLPISIVLIGLSVLLALFIGYTSAWFTYTSSENRNIYATVHVNNINLKVYQVLPDMSDYSYIDITNGTGKLEILPDETYPLRLKLKNEDMGNASLKVKYKIEFFVSDVEGVSTDKKLSVNLTGMEDSTLNASDGYYIYKNGAEALGSGNSFVMMTGFSIPYSQFENLNGDNIKMVVTVEGY